MIADLPPPSQPKYRCASEYIDTDCTDIGGTQVVDLSPSFENIRFQLKRGESGWSQEDNIRFLELAAKEADETLDVAGLLELEELSLKLDEANSDPKQVFREMKLLARSERLLREFKALRK